MTSVDVRNKTEAAREVAPVDMKLEVVVIPVSDLDRAKEFYARLGWRLDADFSRRRLRRGPVHAAGLRVLGPVRHEPHVGRARLGPGPLPDRLRHRGGARRAGRPRRRRGRGLPPRRAPVPGRAAGGRRPRARSRQLRLVRHRSATRTATSGCCRRSPPGCPGGSTRPRRRSAPRATWRARSGVRRPPTASTRSAPASTTRTGPTGTPRTWSAEQAGTELPT